MDGCYVKQESFVDEYGIYVPVNEYVPEGCQSQYRCILTKEMFIEAYEKWIKPTYKVTFPTFSCNDDADCWCE